MDKHTIEELKSELDVVDTSAFDRAFNASGNRVGASTGSLSPDQFADIYPAIRAVLVALGSMWFIPARFKLIIETLVTYLDAATHTKELVK